MICIIRISSKSESPRTSTGHRICPQAHILTSSHPLTRRRCTSVNYHPSSVTFLGHWVSVCSFPCFYVMFTLWIYTGGSGVEQLAADIIPSKYPVLNVHSNSAMFLNFEYLIGHRIRPLSVTSRIHRASWYICGSTSADISIGRPKEEGKVQTAPSSSPS
jgi:hypothetical protein